MKTFNLVSLGCAKNLVDSEVILGLLEKNGWQMEEDPAQAAVLLINTCGFIEPAVQEAIEVILEMAAYKEADPDKFIVVTGCLVQRYQGALEKELLEVDLFIGTEGVPEIPAVLNDLYQGNLQKKTFISSPFLMDSSYPRILTTPFFRSSVKITEGCNNRCTYCMIPTIRGALRSRTVSDLVREVQILEAGGLRELSLIAQDLTAYGRDMDLAGGLPALIRALLDETSVPWIRLMYLYPTGINDDLVSLMCSDERLLPYMDIPFQHVSDRVLKKMHRRYGYKELSELVQRLRNAIPDIAIRSTMMVGFPGETEDDVRLLEDFLSEYRLDHVGIFSYTNEEGALSEFYPGQIHEHIKEERRDRILKLQAAVSEEALKKYVGKTVPVLVEGISRETDLLLEGRTVYQAPDIDGYVLINDGLVNPGDIVNVRISEAQTYDLVGGVV